MAAAPSRRRHDPGGPPDTRAPAADGPPVYDRLDMLVTSEPVAELDDALKCLARQLNLMLAPFSGHEGEET